MKEEWLPVVGYEDFYEVSNMGNVRSIAGRKFGLTGGMICRACKGQAKTAGGFKWSFAL